MIPLDDHCKILAKKLQQHFVYFPDFPKKGIRFWDVFSLMGSKEALNIMVELLKCYGETLKNEGIDVIAGVEARGFLFGPILAEHSCATFVPVRKKGKLPGKTKSITYGLEYGTDTLEVQENCVHAGQKVVIVDDVIATGGTMSAACDLFTQSGAQVVDCVVFVTISDLNGKENIPSSVTVLCPD